PIPQKDYYRLVAFFHNINHFRNGGPTDEVPLLKGPAEQEVYEKQLRDLAAKRKEVETEIEALEGEYGGQRNLRRGGRRAGAARRALGPLPAAAQGAGPTAEAEAARRAGAVRQRGGVAGAGHVRPVARQPARQGRQGRARLPGDPESAGAAAAAAGRQCAHE